MSNLRRRIQEWKKNKNNDPTFNDRYPDTYRDSQNISNPYNPIQHQIKIDRQNNIHPEWGLQNERTVSEWELINHASLNRLIHLAYNLNPNKTNYFIERDQLYNQLKSYCYHNFITFSELDNLFDNVKEKEKQKYKEKLKKYKNNKEKNRINDYNYQEGFNPQLQLYRSPNIFSSIKAVSGKRYTPNTEITSFDDVSPLLSFPDYGSDWSYSYYINNQQPLSKRKRFKKRKASLQKLSFTPPTGTYPEFSDIKQPFNQMISILINNFNAIEKFIKSQQKINEKTSQIINSIEADLKGLKKKI